MTKCRLNTAEPAPFPAPPALSGPRPASARHGTHQACHASPPARANTSPCPVSCAILGRTGAPACSIRAPRPNLPSARAGSPGIFDAIALPPASFPLTPSDPSRRPVNRTSCAQKTPHRMHTPPTFIPVGLSTHQPSGVPPGFGLRQPSGAFRWPRPIRKLRRAGAVQDAGGWSMVPMRLRSWSFPYP